MNDNKPITTKRLGRFQISTWNHVYIRKARDDCFDCERVYESVRARIQYSRYNRKTNEFDRQQIWCDPMELRTLAQLLEQEAEFLQ
jgi:hypothetical protein